MRKSKRVSVPGSKQLELFSKQRRSRRVESSKRAAGVVSIRKSSRVPHQTRPEVSGALHVVLRIRRGLPALRTPRALRRLERAFPTAKEKLGFALVHSVFADRYFALALSGIRQIWRTRYVLNNGRKHGTWTKRRAPDPFSSGRWFRPWQIDQICRPSRRPAVVDRSDFWMPYIVVDHIPGPRGYELAT